MNTQHKAEISPALGGYPGPGGGAPGGYGAGGYGAVGYAPGAGGY